MNIQSVLDNFKNWVTDSERKQLTSVIGMLSAVSMRTLANFQVGWSGTTFEEFRAAQNEVLEQCLLLELSSTGAIVREKLGLSPLTLETEVP